MKLTVKNLCKSYGDKLAVDHVSLCLEPGVHVLLGENGAGKTTLLRMLCGILKPTEGHISLDGLDVRCEEYRALLGYLPQQFGYYPHFTGWDFLIYMAALKGMDQSHAKRRTEEVLDMVNLTDAAPKKIKTYSGGMKQRLGIAQALLGNPKLLIVDEPTSSLDPMERVRFRSIIGDCGKDSIVLFSTHIVADAEHVADDIFMMRHGSVICHEQWDKSRTDLETVYLNTFGGGQL